MMLCLTVSLAGDIFNISLLFHTDFERKNGVSRAEKVLYPFTNDYISMSKKKFLKR